LISIDAKEQGIPALFFCYSQGILEKEVVGTSCPTQKVSCKEDIMSQTLEQFQAYQTRLEQYDQAIALLYWDLQTAAPKDSIEAKLSAVGYFSTESFRLSTADEYGSLLKKLSAPEEYDQLSPAMQLTIRRNLRDFERFQRIPEAFYTEYVTEKARSEKAWEAAKEASDFSVFAPHLDKVISMTKEYVHYMEPDQDVYEFLVGLFEDGMDTETIDRIFAELKEGLLPLLAKIEAAPKPDLSALQQTFDPDAQKKVQELLLSYIGFSFDCGAVAESMHPFTTTLCPGDVRVTNHYYADNPISSMFSAIHEGGHAIFEQNVDKDFWHTAAAQINMMGLHESQSRFYENILGRNPHFWTPIYGKMSELLPEFKTIPFDTFVKAINDVHPSMIRTEADEVTYGLHIILRYEIEKAIFRDNVKTDDLPALWNQKMQELLGITPANDSEGILQDMHWSDGSFGYFPSYLLGSIYDGMYLEAIQKDLGDLDTVLENGRILDITHWLKEKIHRFGSMYNSKEVIQRVCGKEISAQPLLRYFEEKYSKVYEF
jgi:putative metalloprotease ypwA